MWPDIPWVEGGGQNDPIEDNLLGQHCRKQYRRGGLELRSSSTDQQPILLHITLEEKLTLTCCYNPAIQRLVCDFFLLVNEESKDQFSSFRQDSHPC